MNKFYLIISLCLIFISCTRKSEKTVRNSTEYSTSINEDSLISLEGYLHLNSKGDFLFKGINHFNEGRISATYLIPKNKSLKKYIESHYDAYLHLRNETEQFLVSVEGIYLTDNLINKEDSTSFLFNFVALIDNLDSSRQTATLDTVVCGDLLSLYAQKIANLEFVKCTEGEGQIIASAEYRVQGTKSHEVEQFLMDKYGLGKLKFICCGWESEGGENGQIESQKLKNINSNYSLVISMFANAEKESEEKGGYLELDRQNIDFFTVEVQIIEV